MPSSFDKLVAGTYVNSKFRVPRDKKALQHRSNNQVQLD